MQCVLTALREGCLNTRVLPQGLDWVYEILREPVFWPNLALFEDRGHEELCAYMLVGVQYTRRCHQISQAPCSTGWWGALYCQDSQTGS